MTLAWIVFLIVVVFSLIDLKKTVIVWMAVRLFFNAQVALKYTAPAMSLDFGVALWLVLIFFLSVTTSRNRLQLNSESFYFKPILITVIISFFLSFAFSEFPMENGLRQFIKAIIMNFALIYVFQKLLCSKKDVSLFAKSLYVVAILMCFLAFYETLFQDNPFLDYVYYNSPSEGTEGRMWYLPPDVGRGIQYRFGMVRAYSFFGLHIAFGCACAFIIGFFAFADKNRIDFGLNRGRIIFVITILILGCFSSNSKTAFLGLFVMLLMLLNLKVLNMRILVPILMVFVFISLFSSNYLKSVYSIFDENLAEQGGGSTLETRERQYEVAWDMFLHSPIVGNGPGSNVYMKKMEDEYLDLLGSEGAILKILPERGIIGYLVYLFGFVYLFITNRKRMSSYIIFVFLASLFAMELASGLRDKTLFYALLLVMRKIPLLFPEYKNIVQ